MAEIRPFGALRFAPAAGKLSELVCPPYDIISEEQRQAYLEQNPCNIIRLELPREGENPYETAGETLQSWLANGTLACDTQPGLYLYEEEFFAQGKRQTVKGLACLVKLSPFSEGIVLPHEETLSKAKTDRFNLMCATGCNFSSIYSLYFDPQQEVWAQIQALSSKEPDQAFETEDGIVHRLWFVRDEKAIAGIQKAFADKKLYIADGHHRYETALNYREHRLQEGTHTPACDYVMMTLVHMEHPGLVVFPTHRVVRDLDRFDASTILAGCSPLFDCQMLTTDPMEALETCAKQGKIAFALILPDAESHLLVLKDQKIMSRLLPGMSAGYRELDVSVLHTLVLEKLMGIDKENMANQKNLYYTRDPKEAMHAVESGTAQCAFLMNATKVSQIAQVAGAGEKMPQKSTYFYPKIITGHVMNRMD